MLDKEMVKDFLIELGMLTEKYGIEIGGCGHCGSPFLYEIKNDGVYRCYTVDGSNENLEYDIPGEER